MHVSHLSKKDRKCITGVQNGERKGERRERRQGVIGSHLNTVEADDESKSRLTSLWLLQSTKYFEHTIEC